MHGVTFPIGRTTHEPVICHFLWNYSGCGGLRSCWWTKCATWPYKIHKSINFYWVASLMHGVIFPIGRTTHEPVIAHL